MQVINKTFRSVNRALTKRTGSHSLLCEICVALHQPTIFRVYCSNFSPSGEVWLLNLNRSPKTTEKKWESEASVKCVNIFSRTVWLLFHAELTDSAHPTKLLSYIFVNIVHEWQKSGKRHMVRFERLSTQYGRDWEVWIFFSKSCCQICGLISLLWCRLGFRKTF